MNTTQKGLLLLLKSAVTGEHLSLPESFSLEAAEPIIRRQSLLPLAYQGAYNCGVCPKTELMQQYQKQYFKILLHSQKQMRAVQQIYRAFEENRVDYMPLKGCNLKQMYPQPELRMMGDADILIRMEQYPRIKAVMESLGFSEGAESQHELHWERSDLHLELHKCLFAREETDFYPYYGDGWSRAVCKEKYRYELKPEDEYIYLFTHMAKHYRKGGIGCRQLLDLYVYRRLHPEMDETKMEQAAAAIHLLEFYRNTRNLLSVWFADREADEKTGFMTDYIFSGGDWGSMENRILSKQVKYNAGAEIIQNSKLKLMLRAVFPSFYEMSVRYPILKKYPVLLVFCWIHRVFKLAFGRTGAVGRKFRQSSVVTDERVTIRKQQLQFVGLEFHEGNENGE